MKTFLLAATAAICFASAPVSASVLDFSKILSATHAELVAADKDAIVHGDTLASNCWEGTDAYLSTQSGSTGYIAPGLVSGPITLFQAARDDVKFGLSVKASFNATGKLPKPIEAACGGLFLDVADDVRTVTSSVGLGAFNIAIAGKPIF